ncbi:MAG TPA: hypothetical protein VGM74_01875 [Burkholderiaceae bacterium]|jgi:hypothetical protein
MARAQVSFRGDMRPGSDGRCLIDVRHQVEFRCGRKQNGLGQWVDAWTAHGEPHRNAELAGQAADDLRSKLYAVRVRPVIL